MKTNINNSYIKFLLIVVFCLSLSSCEKYLDDTELPADRIAAVDVYDSDNTVSTVITGVFLTMNSSGPFNGSAGYSLGLYTDELRNIAANPGIEPYFKNAIQSGQSLNWGDLYKKLFTINTAIDGINNSKGNLSYKSQWLGECYFLRAYCYYYLLNYYGDVPLVLTNDYSINNKLARASQGEVYQQVIADLKQAQNLLGTDYKNGYGQTTSNRFRPNRAVATALLARIYLYTKDWANAELSATELIADPNYSLQPLGQVFLANSKETILALATNSPKAAYEYSIYNGGMPAILSPAKLPASFSVFASINAPLLSSFESGDGRFTSWIRTSTLPATGTTPATVYYFPDKYKSSANNAEYEVLIRLAELYLIRAEARAMLNKSTAVDDINAVRTRAGLLGIPSGSNQAILLAAIAKERQTELFTECGHRFFDLKRTGAIDAVMNIVAPLKPTTWASYMALFPLPPNDLLQDPNLKPNPGYLQ
jgi:hypothetical protein